VFVFVAPPLGRFISVEVVVGDDRYEIVVGDDRYKIDIDSTDRYGGYLGGYRGRYAIEVNGYEVAVGPDRFEVSVPDDRYEIEVE
jgi:hypothetical protein